MTEKQQIEKVLAWRAARRGLSQPEAMRQDLKHYWLIMTLAMEEVYKKFSKAEAAILATSAREDAWDLSDMGVWILEGVFNPRLPKKFEYLKEKVEGLPLCEKVALFDFLSLLQNNPSQGLLNNALALFCGPRETESNTLRGHVSCKQRKSRLNVVLRTNTTPSRTKRT